MINIKNGVICNFNTFAPAILGNAFANMRVVGLLDYQLAKTMLNITAMQANVSPLLPINVSKDPLTYTYVVLSDVNNVTTVLALEWIDPNSYIEVVTTSVVATISGATAADVSIIRDALLAMGYVNPIVVAK